MLQIMVWEPWFHTYLQIGQKKLSCRFLEYLLPPDLIGNTRQFKHRNTSLSIIDDCLIIVDRVIVPMKLRKAVLKQLHSGHPDVKRMKAIACGVVFWPYIESDIEKSIKSCISCMEALKNPPRIVNIHWIYPDQPWFQIHMDPINGLSF